MKTIILTTALSMLFVLGVYASADGTSAKAQTRTHIFQTNPSSVDVYVAKPAGNLVKIVVSSNSGTPLMKVRVKKQKARYIRFRFNELPTGEYKINVEQDGQSISEMKVIKN